MLIILSPAKSLDYTTAPVTATHTLPAFISRSTELIATLRKFSSSEIGSMMSISETLADLNTQRFADWSPKKFQPGPAKQAVLAFDGDVYGGLDAVSMTARQLEFTQDHVRILSGLYGMLRPLDLMQAYRLEMGTRLANPYGKDLYAFWGDKVTQALNAELAEKKSTALINLASEEYFKVVRPKLLNVPVITPVFEEWKGGKYKIISFYAKRARGLMARYAAVKRITAPEKLKKFDVEGYAFEPALSDARVWRFRRRSADA
jgi:cytoplasmic iron level regulating protein YaaA (DUF328/UPF0246 family)